MNYTTLVGAKTTAGSIKNWSNLSRIDPATVLDFAQSMIFTGWMSPWGSASALRVRQMRKSTTLSMIVGDSTEALPSRLLEVIRLRDITNGHYLEQVHEADMVGLRSYTDGVLDDGTPSYFAIYDEVLNFDRKYDAVASLAIVYYEEPARLAASSNETNWLTDRYPRLLMAACQLVASEFMNHPEDVQRHAAVFASLVSAANAESDLGRQNLLLGYEVP